MEGVRKDIEKLGNNIERWPQSESLANKDP